MNDARKIEPEKIHLVKLQTLKGMLNYEVYGKDAMRNDYDYCFDASIAVNAADRVVGIKLTVDVNAANPKQVVQATVASYTHELIFEVDNLDDFTEPGQDQQKPKVDRLMLGTLLGIAYSTIRGIIFTRTQGPEAAGILLPVIDPKQLLKPEEKPQVPEHSKQST